MNVVESVLVTDVGDGLCAGLTTLSGAGIQIDCGSQQGPEKAARGLEILRLFFPRGPSCDAFILSHFHTDHYNGLFSSTAGRYMRRRGSQAKEVYFPRLPDLPQKRDFLAALYSICVRTFGDASGVMQYDLLSTMRGLTGGPVKYWALAEGDVVDVSGSVLEVLWPPRMANGTVVKSVQKALELFERACKEDVDTATIYKKVSESHLLDPYLEEANGVEVKGLQADHPQVAYERKSIPRVVKEADDALRKAANRISLAFREGGAFLFMGDTESNEINAIAKELDAKDRRDFSLLLTPHHGTHWGNDLRRIRCEYALTSVGKGLIAKCEEGFKQISQRALSTFSNGGLLVPILHPPWDRRFYPWWHEVDW